MQDSNQAVFRALGLYVTVAAFRSLRHPFGKGLEERIKIALHKDRSMTLLRALIHVVPMGVALWEITININTYYLDSSVLNLVYYRLVVDPDKMGWMMPRNGSWRIRGSCLAIITHGT